jgi:Homoserine acetyltransferase
METLKSDRLFTTETGAELPGIEIAYNTWGKMNSKGDNVIWICHALTANSDVESWWPGMVGSGLLFDPDKYFMSAPMYWALATGRQVRLLLIN